MSALEVLNAAVRFALELCALAALAFWGFTVADTLPLDLLLGLGAPLAFALVWGAFVAPKAPFRLPDPQRLMLEATVFGIAAIALLAAAAPLLAVVLVVSVAVNIGFMVYLGQRRQGGI
jgi:hypothetical protein